MAHAQKHLHHELSAHKQSWQIKYFQEEVVHKLSNCLGDFEIIVFYSEWSH